jgi:hypothetical protein
MWPLSSRARAPPALADDGPKVPGPALVEKPAQSEYLTGAEAVEYPAVPPCAPKYVEGLRRSGSHQCAGDRSLAERSYANGGYDVFGTAADEVILGSSGGDHIDGGGGHDILCGDGNSGDYADGGVESPKGVDTVFANSGCDVTVNIP